MDSDETTRIFPEDEANDSLKTKIIIEDVPVKKKRRFIYYFLCIFITFIIVRGILILVSFYRLDLNKLILKNMKYDSSNPESITLDLQIAGAYSPLFIRIKDIECDVYGNDEKGCRRRLFGLDIPDIEIIKYKTLSFKNDITFKNCDANDMYECRNTKEVVVKMKVKLYFRFCLMLFYISWNDEKPIKLRDDNNKIRWPRINEIGVKNVDDSISVAFDVDHSSIDLPPYVNVTLAEAEVRCGQDLPCSIFFSEQNITEGKFKSPLIITVLVKKEDYGKIIRSIIDLVNDKKIHYEISEIITNKKNELRRRYKLAFARAFNKPEEDTKKEIGLESNPNDGEKKEESGGHWKFNGPVAVVEDVRIEKNVLSCNVKVDPKALTLIKRDTKIVFENVVIHSKIRMFEYSVAEGVLLISSEKHYINLSIRVTISGLQRALDFLVAGKINFSFELGDDTKQHSLLKGLKLEYDVESFSVKYSVYKYRHVFSKSEDEQGGSILHNLTSNDEKITIKSEIYKKVAADTTGKAIFLIKTPKMKIKFQHEFFDGSLTFGRLDSAYVHAYVYDSGFYGSLKSVLEIKPKKEKFNGLSDLSGLFSPKFKAMVFSDSLIYDYKQGESEGQFDFRRIRIDYLGCKDLQNHFLGVNIKPPIQNTGVSHEGGTPSVKGGSTPSVKGGSISSANRGTLHKLNIGKDTINLNFYTKGAPLVNLKPNISVKDFAISLQKNNSGNLEIRFSPNIKADLYLSDLNLLKSLLYGEFAFFSNRNVLSYVIAHYLNHLMTQKAVHEGKKVINKECTFFLQLDESEVDERDDLISSSYSGVVRIHMPSEVVDSFLIEPFSLPTLFFSFESGDVMKRSEETTFFKVRSSREGEFVCLEVNFNLNPLIFKEKGTELLWAIISPEKEGAEEVKSSSRITNVSDSLPTILRMFFLKMFQLPLEEKAMAESKIGLFVEYDKVKKGQDLTKGDLHFCSINTNVLCVLYADPMEDFFVNGIPEIILKCGFKVVPKYFRMTMQSKRLNLLFIKMLSRDADQQDKIEAYARGVQSDALFHMQYPSNMEVEEGKCEIKKPEEVCLFHPTRLPKEIARSKGKLVFTGEVALDCIKRKDLVLSGMVGSTPFPFFLVEIMKAPSKDPMIVFTRACFLDFALGMPFSLDVVSKDDLKYELTYKGLSLLKDLVLCDQGRDKFLHLPLRNINHDTLFELLKAISNREDEKFTLVFRQGEKDLLETSFRLDKTIYNTLEYKFGKLMSTLSEIVKENKKNFLSALRGFLT